MPSSSRSQPLRRLGLTALAAALVLAGCASPRGIESKAVELKPAAVGYAGTGFTIDSRWWQGFGDPALDTLVQRALSDSPNLRAAQTRIERAAAGLAAARGGELPTVGANVDVTRQRYSENGLFPPPIAGSTLTSADLRAQLSWQIDFFGRNRAAIEAALGAQRAAEAEGQAARVGLASGVARAYVQLARLFEQRSVAERALAQREEMLKLTRQRVTAGLDTNVELRQSEAALPDTRVQLEAIDEQIALTRNALAALTAQPPSALASLKPGMQALRGVSLPADVPADLVGRRADIAAARARIEAATGEVAAARAQFYPSVNLTAFIGLNAIGLDNLAQAGSRQIGVGPAVSLPIFDAGRLRANLGARTADLDAAVEQYNLALIDALHDAVDQIASLKSLTRQQREQRDAQAAAESAYELALQRYRAGIGGYLTVLTAEASVLAQRRAGVDLKAREIDTQVALIRALGGGYAAPDPVRTASTHDHETNPKQ